PTKARPLHPFSEYYAHKSVYVVLGESQSGVLRSHPTVDDENGTVDERTRGQRERQRRVRDLFGLTVATDWDAAARELRLCVIGDGRGHPGVDRAGTHAVHGHAARSEFDREATGQSDHAVLRCGVRRDGGCCAEAFGRRDVDDAAVAVAHEMWQARADQS